MFKSIWHREKQPQVKELVEEAHNLSKLGRYEEALAICERARQLTTDPGILKLIALTLSMMKLPAEALAACDIALSRNPQDGALWGLKGAKLVELKRYAEALNPLDMALHHLPATEVYWYAKVTSLSALKRYEDVVETCHRGLNYIPSSTRLWTYAGNALMALNRYEDALASYEEAERLDRANAGALIGKGWALQ